MGFLGRLFGRNPERRKTENHKKELGERKEALRSEEIKLNLALRDMEELKKLEDELLEKGKAENSSISKRTVAYKIKDLREKQKNLDSRIQIYNNRIKVLHQQISSLETLVEAGTGGLPDEQQIEAASFEASQKLENLNNLLMKVESSRPESDREDDDIDGIMHEFDARADRDLKRAELETTRREEERRETPSETQADLEPPEAE